MSPRDVTEYDPPLYLRLLISWGTNAILLGIVVWILAGASVNNVWALLEAAAIFGVLNTLVKPIVKLVTLPIAVITLGVAWFFVALLMLIITNALVGGLHIHGFWTYVDATVIIWLANLVLDFVPGPWQLAGKRGRSNRRR